MSDLREQNSGVSVISLPSHAPTLNPAHAHQSVGRDAAPGLIEITLEKIGCHEIELAQEVISMVSERGAPVVLIASPSIPNPHVWWGKGVFVPALIVVEPTSAADACWAALQACEYVPGCGCLLWLTRDVRPAMIWQLRRAFQRTQSHGLCFATTAVSQVPGAACRWRVSPQWPRDRRVVVHQRGRMDAQMAWPAPS